MDADFSEIGFDRQPGEIAQNWVLNVELALVLKLQNHDGGKGFRDGPYLEAVQRRDGRLGIEIGKAESGDRDGSLDIGEREREAGCVHGTHVLGDVPAK